LKIKVFENTSSMIYGNIQESNLKEFLEILVD